MQSAERASDSSAHATEGAHDDFTAKLTRSPADHVSASVSAAIPAELADTSTLASAHAASATATATSASDSTAVSHRTDSAHSARDTSALAAEGSSGDQKGNTNKGKEGKDKNTGTNTNTKGKNKGKTKGGRGQAHGQGQHGHTQGQSAVVSASDIMSTQAHGGRGKSGGARKERKEGRAMRREMEREAMQGRDRGDRDRGDRYGERDRDRDSGLLNFRFAPSAGQVEKTNRMKSRRYPIFSKEQYIQAKCALLSFFSSLSLCVF